MRFLPATLEMSLNRLGDSVESVFGPAEFIQGLLQTGKGQADNVEVAAFDARNEAACATLDAVSPGLIVFFS
jgi:hypothetical protein